MVSNSAGPLPHRATLIGEASEKHPRLWTHYAHGGSQWTGDEEQKFVLAVKAAGIECKSGDGEHLQEYGLSRETYQRMMGTQRSWKILISGLRTTIKFSIKFTDSSEFAAFTRHQSARN